MVLPIDSEAIVAMESSGSAARYRGRAFYGPDITNDDVPLYNSGSITYNGTASVQGSGTCYLANTGTDLVPRQLTDTFAPFGQELAIARVVSRGNQEWEIPLGRFRITEVPSMEEYFRRYPSRRDAIGWQLQLTIRDRFDILENDDFVTPTSATAGGSTWTEIQRIAPQGIGILVSDLPDALIPAGITYTSLSDAIVKLMSNINGVPHMTRDGLLTARQKDKWLTATVPQFTVNGTIDVSDSMSNKIYNCVVVTNPNDAKINEVAQIEDPADPLSVTGPLGRRVYKMSDPLMTTSGMAQRAAQTSLARVSSQQARQITFSSLPRPDLELGDFGDLIDELSGRTYRGEIANLGMSLDPTEPMTGAMTVAEVIEP